MVSSLVLWAIKSLAATTSVMMICSPSISMYRIHGKKDVGVASVIPLASLLANGHMWMLYGYMVENWFPIFWVFVFGDIAALAYIAVCWRYTAERRYVGRVLAAVFSIMAVVTLYAGVGGFGYTGQSRRQVGSTLGFICDVVAVCLYGAPMEKLLHVLKYRSAVFINAHMVVAGLSNNCTWITYGVLTHNWFIISPNILFISLNAFTLVLYLVFNPKTHPLPDSFHHPAVQHAAESAISVELTPKESFCRKVAGSELPSPASFEALASPLETLPW
jgi:solute carrier family 50 protein (sugar transporter)